MTRIQVRRGPSTGAGSWSTVNPTLAAGEFGFETDTQKFKIGDGSTAWNSLGYAQSGASSTLGSPLTAGTGVQFDSGTTFDGASPKTLSLSSTISSNTSGNAATATKFASTVNINGASFDGSSAVIVGSTVYGTSAVAGATFRNIFVTQSTPSGAQNGDVWISW